MTFGFEFQIGQSDNETTKNLMSRKNEFLTRLYRHKNKNNLSGKGKGVWHQYTEILSSA